VLTGKQKRYLRALAVNKKAIFQIGKDGLSKELIQGLNDALKKQELVKLSVLKTCDTDMNELELDIISGTKAELVQKIGKTLVLYKKSKEPKIILP